MAAKYGLPEDVRFCVRCVMSNQRPNSCVEFSHTADSIKPTIHFDEDGVCDACRVAEAKEKTDWKAREEELQALLAQHRSKSGAHDCIVPGSGGKDSFLAAHTLKYKYGMHPLTVTWAPHIYTPVGRRNFDRWLEAGFDNILVTPNPRTHRLLTRLAVENLFHPFQPFIIGQKAMAPKLALLHRIPLVFYGESEAEYGNPKADIDASSRGDVFYRHSKSETHLGGVHIDNLRMGYGLGDGDLAPYLPVDLSDIGSGANVRVDVRYLGYYLKWHPQGAFYYAREHGGFEVSEERTPGTWSKYNSLDDCVDDFHYWTTYQKFGIGRATYDAAQEIRSGEITRDEGVALVKRFDGEYPERFEREVNEYLSVDGFAPMTRERWMMLAEKFRSPHLFTPEGKLRHKVWRE